MIGKWIRSLPFNFANINYTLTAPEPRNTILFQIPILYKLKVSDE